MIHPFFNRRGSILFLFVSEIWRTQSVFMRKIERIFSTISHLSYHLSWCYNYYKLLLLYSSEPRKMYLLNSYPIFCCSTVCAFISRCIFNSDSLFLTFCFRCVPDVEIHQMLRLSNKSQKCGEASKHILKMLGKSNIKLNCRTRTQPKDHILSRMLLPLNSFSRWNEAAAHSHFYGRAEQKKVNGLIISWHGFHCFRQANKMEHVTNETNKL